MTLYTKLLLEHVDGNKTISEITDEFNTSYNTKFSIDNIREIFSSQICGYGILENDKLEKIIIKDSYLKLRLTLISQRIVTIIAGKLTFLFGVKRFITLFLISLIVLLYFLTSQTFLEAVYDKITSKVLLYFYIFNIIGLFVHEFGHAAACKKFGAKSGAIGFGFYLFTPVFYADVTDAWRLNRYQRLIVDLAGIYIQIFYCLGLIGIYFLTSNDIYFIVSFLIAATIILNTNPFLRYDGYWALSDLINIPNLRSKSNKIVFDMFKSVRNKSIRIEYSATNIFLIVYGLLSLMFVIAFVSYMMFFRNNSIIYFPFYLYDFFATLVRKFPNIEFIWFKSEVTKFFLPLLFYYLVINYIRKRLGKVLTFLKTKLWN